jgi:signal transduction histidine kinase
MALSLLGRVDGRSLRLAAVFVLITGLLLAALAAIALHQIEVERDANAVRRTTETSNAAALLTGEVERQFVLWERAISDAAVPGPAALPPDIAILYFDDAGVTRATGAPLPFYPVVAAAVSDFPSLGTIESLEYGGHRDAAESAYLDAASAPDPRLRAAALARLARSRRPQPKEALAAYESLASLGDVPVSGIPADLLAYRARAAILDQMGDRAAAGRERARFDRALWSERHLIDRPTFDALRGEDQAPSEVAGALDMAAAASAFWAEWQTKPAGRAVRQIEGQRWVSAWHAVQGQHGALVARAAPLEADLHTAASALAVDVALLDPLELPGASPPPPPAIARTAYATGLPWTVVVRPNNPDSPIPGARSGALIAALFLMTVAIAASGYFVFRAVNREVGVARLQSDFVSAVSHEFRSPLTAMHHLTDMLEDGGADPARLPDYYRALGRETRRLHGLVETLLDFGRIEAGGRTYTLTPVDLSEVLRDVVTGISASDPTLAARVQIEMPATPVVVTADTAALAVAARNLIDNALKYSPSNTAVRVVVSMDGAHVTLAVEDRGPGLSPHEQREIFRKFVRGSAARDLGVKGTGIGLTMAKHLVAAQGGTISVESAPGRGSRFALVLPVKE